MANCIFCGKATGDDGAQMTINVEAGKVAVDICAVHAEEATIKTVKEAYLAQQDKIAQFLEQAKSLGLELAVAPKGGLMVAQQTKAPPVSPQQPVKREVAVAPTDDEDMVPTSLLDRKQGIVSVGGRTDMGQVQSYGSHETSGLQDKLPEGALDGHARLAMTEGRSGKPIVFATERRDKTGTTLVSINKNENDQTLQRRFKKMADRTMNDDVPDFKSGYQQTMVTCTLCRGKQIIKGSDRKDIICPKCGGLGEITVY